MHVSLSVGDVVFCYAYLLAVALCLAYIRFWRRWGPPDGLERFAYWCARGISALEAKMLSDGMFEDRISDQSRRMAERKMVEQLNDWTCRTAEVQERHYAEEHTHVFCLEVSHTSMVIRWCACGRAEVLCQRAGSYIWVPVEEPGADTRTWRE